MIQIKDLLGLPSLQYHIDNELSLHENVYRYSSTNFIQLFAEARDAYRDGKIQLNEEDLKLIETTDIGLYGVYEANKVPLDLPMINEDRAIITFKNDYEVKMNTGEGYDDDFEYFKAGEREQVYILDKNDKRVHIEFGDGTNAYIPTNIISVEEKSLEEAKYKGKDVPLNKPKRGGSKKFFVYTKNKKGNVVKVSFGGTTGLSVKIKEKGARASFAARHKCATKKDKTKPGYWACNVGRYWKSLGGAKNFSGYW